MSEATRTVLFLGAGASRPFGFPMTAEILPEVLLGQNEEVENRYRLLFPDLEFEGGGVEGFVASLQA